MKAGAIKNIPVKVSWRDGRAEQHCNEKMIRKKGKKRSSFAVILELFISIEIE
jgi:hypothetical protein